MEYKELKLIEVRRKKIMSLSIIGAVFFHMMLFFAFRITFVPYEKVAVPKTMKVRRVRIPPGNRPGPLSASAARKRAKPKPVKKTVKKPTKKKKVKKKPKLQSKLKVPSKQVEKPPVDEQVDISLDQKESEVDVLSMIEDGAVIPGGGNLGTDPDAWGIEYDDDMIFGYGDDDEPEEVASVARDDFLGTMATPVVKSNPRTAIDTNHTKIPYPDSIKIKKENLKAGVCRVYIRLTIDNDGEVQGIYVRSPKRDEDKVKYKIFLDSVIDTVHTWSFEPKATTVFVDVRFTIE